MDVKSLSPSTLSNAQEGSSSEWVRTQVERAREDTRSRFLRGLGAAAAAAGMAAHVETMVVALYQRAVALEACDEDLGVVALGSLGRRELGPYSDLDLVLISRTPDHPRVRAAANAFFYPLWDARLDIGHALRSPKDFAHLVQTDQTICTGALDWRAVAGPAALMADLDKALSRALTTRPVRGAMRQSIETWLADDDATDLHHMQPDIKHGKGGLREVQRAWWAARLLWQIKDWQDLCVRDLALAHDVATLVSGHETLLGIRLALHFATGRREDQLRSDLRAEVAASLGIVESDERVAADELLRRFFKSARGLRLSAQHVLARCLAGLDTGKKRRVKRLEGFAVIDGALTADTFQLAADPREIVRVFGVAQALGLRLHPLLSERITANCDRLLTVDVARDPLVRRRLIDLLVFLRDDGRMLWRMYELGVLERLVPEIRAVTGLPQREPFHVYTVDAHLVMCARAAITVLAGSDSGIPSAIAAVAERVSRPHVLVLAALLHDIGKGRGRGHSERGASLAREVVARLLLDPEDQDDVVFLVREHLSMFRISQRRDLHDPDLIASFAEQVQTSERLDMLLVLSFADAVATGPGIWTEWKASLLHELHARTLAALRTGTTREDLAARSQVKEAELRALLVGPNEPLLAFMRQLTPRHLVSHPADVIQRQLHVMQRADTQGVCCTIHYNPALRAWEAIAVGPDRPGLLADLAGELAATGISIDSARISSSTQGLAVDTFVMTPTRSTTLANEIRRAALERRLEDALRGRCCYAARLAERRRAATALRSKAPLPETRVVFDLDARGHATIVDFFAPDHAGLLHDVARTIFASGASIVLARINTEAGRAEDAFYVVNASTALPLNDDERARLKSGLEEMAARRTSAA